jgi:hypothetical protein
MNPISGGVIYKDQSFPGKRFGYSADKHRDNFASVVFSDAKQMDYENRFAEEERLRRQNDYQKKQEAFMKRREAKVLKEAGRWQAVDEDYKRSIQKLDVKRSIWKAGQKNNPSEAFNVITLDYDNTQQGEYLKSKDQEKKYREGLRMYNLDARMNSGFNVITGATRQSPVLQKFY